MKLNIATHKTILFQILKGIYSDTNISPFLGFKGGTAALMFYGLDRFSVDLDFDLLPYPPYKTMDYKMIPKNIKYLCDNGIIETPHLSEILGLLNLVFMDCYT